MLRAERSLLDRQSSGEELFRFCEVVPVFSQGGKIVEHAGRLQAIRSVSLLVDGKRPPEQRFGVPVMFLKLK